MSSHGAASRHPDPSHDRDEEDHAFRKIDPRDGEKVNQDTGDITDRLEILHLKGTTFNVFLTGVRTGVNTSRRGLRRQQHSVRRTQSEEDLDHYRVLHEHAVDGDVDPEEESHVILLELPDHSFLGTVSSQNLHIPEFDPSQMQEEGMTELRWNRSMM